jgi:hypothetical protein
MRFIMLGLLAFPLLVTSVASSWQVSITMDGDVAPAPLSKQVTHLSEDIPTFDDKRIKHHPDKVLLGRIREFFKTFTTGDFDGMKDLQSKDYTMTNIRKTISQSL